MRPVTLVGRPFCTVGNAKGSQRTVMDADDRRLGPPVRCPCRCCALVLPVFCRCFTVPLTCLFALRQSGFLCPFEAVRARRHSRRHTPASFLGSSR